MRKKRWRIKMRIKLKDEILIGKQRHEGIKGSERLV